MSKTIEQLQAELNEANKDVDRKMTALEHAESKALGIEQAIADYDDFKEKAAEHGYVPAVEPPSTWQQA